MKTILIFKSLNKTIIIAMFFVVSYSCFSQGSRKLPENIILNYSFEYSDVFARPISWIPQNTERQYIIDTFKDPISKTISLKITPKPNAAEKRGVGLCNTVISKFLLQGRKKITIKAQIKTEDLTNGIVSIWMQLNGNMKIISDKNSDAESPKGNSDWKQYSIELPLTEDTNSVSFGCKMTGTGIAWFDNFEVLLDNEVFK